MGQSSSQPAPPASDMPAGYTREMPTVVNYGKIFQTKTPGRVGIHQSNNWYYRDAMNNGPALLEPPRPYYPLNQSRGTPLSALNRWPEKCDNANIFEFFFEPPASSPYKDFYQFVRQHYQCSCAIVVENSMGMRKISGSGGLTHYNQRLQVVTARHVVEHVANENIFVRFFRYKVGELAGRDCIIESSIDLPVLDKVIASEGVDGCYLTFAEPVDENLFAQHTCLVEGYNTAVMQSLPAGRYALFHFAYGQHLISLGEIKTTKYLHLHDNIRIQAGSGASGAMLLHHVDGSPTKSRGISIYRFRKDGYCDNRLLAYQTFVQARAIDDITAPFRIGIEASDIRQHDFEQAGYEYVDWERYLAGGGVAREESPGLPMYGVLANHSNHHILPIRYLQYLWDYFHLNYDRGNGDEFQIPYARRLREVDSDKIYKEAVDVCRINPGLFSCDKLVAEKTAALFKKRYAKTSKVLDNLCWPLAPSGDNLAWANWNLFKGWNRTIRGGEDPGDKPEPNKPPTFDVNLWGYIDKLKLALLDLSAINSRNRQRNVREEKACSEALRKLQHYVQSSADFQRKVREQGHFIHLYSVADWDKQGHKNGHEIWHVKK